MNKVYIMRGPSGCGKSTKAKEISSKYSFVICSADNFFINNETGKYNFNPQLLKRAHSNCRQDFINALEKNIECVIVDNTNTQFWEAQFYIFTALAYNYEVNIVEPETEWAFNVEELTKRNVHGVPKESIEKMVRRYESSKQFAGKISEIALLKVKCECRK